MAIVIVLVVSRNFIMRFIYTFTNIIRPPGSLPPAVPLVKQNIKLVWPNWLLQEVLLPNRLLLETREKSYLLIPNHVDQTKETSIVKFFLQQD